MKNAITNRRRRERGMTLAEALIAVLVFSVVFLAALMLYNTANRAYIATDSATIQQQNARFAMLVGIDMGTLTIWAATTSSSFQPRPLFGP